MMFILLRSIVLVLRKTLSILTGCVLISLLCLACCSTGCGFIHGWQMDYGRPAAQFMAQDVATLAEPYIGKKIKVQGMVEGRDFTDPDDAVLILEHQIFCHFGKFARMAQAYADGETGWVDGFLVQCKPGKIVIRPALGSDPAAHLEPLRPTP